MWMVGPVQVPQQGARQLDIAAAATAAVKAAELPAAPPSRLGPNQGSGPVVPVVPTLALTRQRTASGARQGDVHEALHRELGAMEASSLVSIFDPAFDQILQARRSCWLSSPAAAAPPYRSHVWPFRQQADPLA